MALQVPTELPLGLVFVAGEVQNVTLSAGQTPQFDLVEAGMSLRCRLSVEAAAEVLPAEGDQIRAGGHLAFDHRQARYYLFARDVEVLGESALPAMTNDRGRMALQGVLADVGRRSAAPTLAAENLPDWVKEMAPPEIRAELDLATDAVPVQADAVLDNGLVNGVSQELIDFVSDAMDGAVDLELTPDILSQFIPAGQGPQATPPLVVLDSDSASTAIDWLTVGMVGAAMVLITLILLSLIWLILNP